MRVPTEGADRVAGQGGRGRWMPVADSSANDPIRGALNWRQARTALRHPRFYEGFQEAMAGLPFDYGRLDRLSEADQHRYENGREIALECRNAGLEIRWPQRESVPLALKRLVLDRARRRADGARRTAPYVVCTVM